MAAPATSSSSTDADFLSLTSADISSSNLSLSSPFCQFSIPSSRECTRGAPAGSLPMHSPNPFLLFRTHLIASARESGVTVQGKISKMASLLWATMDELDKQEWKCKAALAKQALAAKKLEHPELCTRKRARRGSLKCRCRSSKSTATACTQPEGNVTDAIPPFAFNSTSSLEWPSSTGSSLLASPTSSEELSPGAASSSPAEYQYAVPDIACPKPSRDFLFADLLSQTFQGSAVPPSSGEDAFASLDNNSLNFSFDNSLNFYQTDPEGWFRW